MSSPSILSPNPSPFLFFFFFSLQHRLFLPPVSINPHLLFRNEKEMNCEGMEVTGSEERKMRQKDLNHRDSLASESSIDSESQVPRISKIRWFRTLLGHVFWLFWLVKNPKIRRRLEKCIRDCQKTPNRVNTNTKCRILFKHAEFRIHQNLCAGGLFPVDYISTLTWTIIRLSLTRSSGAHCDKKERHGDTRGERSVDISKSTVILMNPAKTEILMRWDSDDDVKLQKRRTPESFN